MESPITVMTYNLRDRGKGSRERESAQDAWLADHLPTILTAQEFWDPTGRHGDDLVADLADRLGMCGFAVPSPNSNCHLGLLWQPEQAELISFEAIKWNFWHGVGVGTFRVGGRTLRVVVAHLAPTSPPQRFMEAYNLAKLADTPGVPTIIGADFNNVGELDPEPDIGEWGPNQRARRREWSADPAAPTKVDRRPMLLLSQAGVHDAATVLQADWYPTADLAVGSGVRFDGIRVNGEAAGLLWRHRVYDSPELRELSDHLPVAVTLAV